MRNKSLFVCFCFFFFFFSKLKPLDHFDDSKHKNDPNSYEFSEIKTNTIYFI